MNLNRRSNLEDALFAAAIVIPAAVAAARLIQDERSADAIVASRSVPAADPAAAAVARTAVGAEPAAADEKPWTLVPG